MVNAEIRTPVYKGLTTWNLNHGGGQSARRKTCLQPKDRTEAGSEQPDSKWPHPGQPHTPRAFQCGQPRAAPDFLERVITPRTVCTFQMGKKILGEILLSHVKGKYLGPTTLKEISLISPLVY